MIASSQAPTAADDVTVAIEATQEDGRGVVGTVTAAGERSAVLVGRRVLVGPIDPCGECEVCRRGGAPVCPLARHRGRDLGAELTAMSRWVVALGDGIELPLPAAAAVPGDIAIAYTLYARTGVGPREPVVVTGATAVTRFLVEILVAKGITPAVVVDPAAPSAWIDWLLAKGAAVARAAANGAEGDARTSIGGAFAAQGLGARPWRLIATTADTALLAAALTGPRSTLTVLGAGPALPADLMTREVTVIGVAGAHPDLVVEVAAMCVKGDIDLAAGTATGANAELRTIVASR